MIISSDMGEPALYAQVVDWSNLILASKKAARHKRGKPSAAGFEHQLADHLIALQDELITLRYQPGGYVPKHRKISAAPFRDRVVHHALCNVIEPSFEAQFIPHSYANRVGKGTHRAIDRLQVLVRRYRYVLRADIVRHFPSIGHAILYDILADTIHDDRTCWLLARIIDSGQGVLADEYEMVWFEGDGLFAQNRPRGLPIGNLTSQFWSNVYLNPLDWFIQQDLGWSIPTLCR